MGVEGLLLHSGRQINVDEDLVDQETYHYSTRGTVDISRAVDPEVIKERSNVPSDSSSRDNFRNRLLERDGRCAWTQYVTCDGMHIIPRARGSDWLKIIIDNRPRGNEILEDIDIDDVRNGVAATPNIHTEFDTHELVVLKTPNPVLQCIDVPNRYGVELAEDVVYPANERFTLQQLYPPRRGLTVLPNNVDAAFRRNTEVPKPSDLLLHYTYGAAVVKWWGHGKVVLEEKRKRPDRRPAGYAEHRMGATRVRNPKGTVIQKRAAAQDATSGNSSGTINSEGETLRDEYDIMLFLWGNTTAAVEHHRWREEETNQRLEQWRQAVL